MKRLSIIELQKESMHFSAGHFTIFSAENRENFHGHNYQVAIALALWVEKVGLNFDYRFYKNLLQKLCKQLDQTFLIPINSPYLTCREENGYIWLDFHDEKIPFLKRDVTLLPVANITVEELSYWFIQALTEDVERLREHRIHQITVKVFSGQGQSGSATWQE